MFDMVNLNLSIMFNFINLNVLLDGISNDNSVFFIYDFIGGVFIFGINFDLLYVFIVDDLLNFNNVVLDVVIVGCDIIENLEDVFCVDFMYFFDNDYLMLVDFGYWFNKLVSIFDDVGLSIGLSCMFDSFNGFLFVDLFVFGLSNFGFVDGRELVFWNFLFIDFNLLFNDLECVLSSL